MNFRGATEAATSQGENWPRDLSRRVAVDSDMALIVVIRRNRGDSRVERRGYSGDLSAAGDRAEQDDPVLVDFGPLVQEVYRADHVPRRPSRITFTHEKELLGEVESRAVALAIPRRGLGPFAISRTLDDQHRASGPRPELAHIVQLALCLRIVLAVHDEDRREWRCGVAPEGRDSPPSSMPAGLKHDVLEPVAVAIMPRCHSSLKRRFPGGKPPTDSFSACTRVSRKRSQSSRD